MKFLTFTQSVLSIAQLASLTAAADCGDPYGLGYGTTYVPSGAAWNAFQYAINIAKYGSLKGSYIAYGPNKVGWIELQKDGSGAGSISHAADAWNNIWSQCMNSGYSCNSPAKKTGTWQYDNQWYWINFYMQDSGAHDVYHCDLGPRDGSIQRRGSDLANLKVQSVNATYVTKDKMPFPERFANDKEDQLYEQTVVYLG